MVAARKASAVIVKFHQMHVKGHTYTLPHTLTNMCGQIQVYTSNCMHANIVNLILG